MNTFTHFEFFMKTYFPSVSFSEEEKDLVSSFECDRHYFLDMEKYHEGESIFYYYVLAKIATAHSPQTVIILTKNENKPMILQTFKIFIEESNFGQMTKESTSINFTRGYMTTLSSKIFVKSSIESCRGMTADLVIVEEEFEDQYFDVIPFLYSCKVIFKFPKPEENLDNVNFFDIAREESFSSSLFKNVSELISKIGRTNLSELIFLVLEEERNRNDCSYEHELNKFFQKLEMMNDLDDLYIRKRTSYLFNKFKIYEICECFNELFPSWGKYLTSQNLQKCSDDVYVECFILEKYLQKMKRYVEKNSISHSFIRTNKIHTQCQIAFNKVFFSNLNRIIRELERKN